MPVRFRCKHCNQLLGIARRKIGMEVRCPECHKMVLVPAKDALDLDEPTRKRDPLFEGDVAAPLRPSAADPTVEPPKSESAPQFSIPGGAFDVEPYRPPDPAPVAGFVLSPLHATLLTIGAVLILALAFAVGLLVGRYLL
jgi:phage FluMu protein Com